MGEYDELLAQAQSDLRKVQQARESERAHYGRVSNELEERVIALTAQVQERDAVIEHVRKWRSQWNQLAADLMELDKLDAALSQAPRDALAAHNAEIWDQGSRATAVEFGIIQPDESWFTNADNPYREDQK